MLGRREQGQASQGPASYSGTGKSSRRVISGLGGDPDEGRDHEGNQVTTTFGLGRLGLADQFIHDPQRHSAALLDPQYPLVQVSRVDPESEDGAPQHRDNQADQDGTTTSPARLLAVDVHYRGGAVDPPRVDVYTT